MSIKEKLAKRIKNLRQTKGLTQEKLSEKAGISISFLGGIERGTQSPTIETLDKIAQALDVPLKVLLTFDDENNKNEKYELSKIIDMLNDFSDKLDTLLKK